jgi:hypothetical protein
MLTLWLIRLFPFLDKWLHVAPACCGGCPTCIGVGVTGLALDVVAAKPSADQQRDAAQHQAVRDAEGL